MTTVFRLPEEPPALTTVESIAGGGERYTRVELSDPHEESRWRCGHSQYFSWVGLFIEHPEGLRVVEPDPHPTPWQFNEDTYGDVRVLDETGKYVVSVAGSHKYETAQRIVDAVNKAAET